MCRMLTPSMPACLCFEVLLWSGTLHVTAASLLQGVMGHASHTHRGLRYLYTCCRRLLCCLTHVIFAFFHPGASLASRFLLASNTVSLGASGAVFGLFTMAVLTKFRWSFKKLLECAILGQFVFKTVMQVSILLSHKECLTHHVCLLRESVKGQC